MASNKLLTGNHWIMVATDIQANISYYCDPLGYPIPPNLVIETQPTFIQLKRALNQEIQISYPLLAMHRPMFDANSRDVCSKLCLNFPVQTCSSLCGAIAIVFIAVVANCPQEVWQYVCLPNLQVNRLRPKLVLYQQPSEYAPYIRKILAGWILTKN